MCARARFATIVRTPRPSWCNEAFLDLRARVHESWKAIPGNGFPRPNLVEDHGTGGG